MQEIIKIISAECGALFGFCPFSAVAERLIDCRAKSRLPKAPKTVICFAFPYKVRDEAPKNISRYAAVPDYHEVCGEQLEMLAEMLKEKYPQNEFCAFADNSPIPEVYAAARAGLGAVGKNGLLITERFGSFVFLGEIVTNMEIAAEEKEIKGCLDCGACKRACPSSLSKQTCLSAITQQKRELTEEQKKLILENGSVWGCDICQNVCPMNKGAEKTKCETFINGYRDSYCPQEDIAGRVYAWRGEGVILRNALMLDDIPQVVATDAAAEKHEGNI